MIGKYLVVSLIASVFALAACDNRECLRSETATGYKRVCKRYSDTGHCAFWGQEQYTYQKCVEYAQPAARPDGEDEY